MAGDWADEPKWDDFDDGGPYNEPRLYPVGKLAGMSVEELQREYGRQCDRQGRLGDAEHIDDRAVEETEMRCDAVEAELKRRGAPTSPPVHSAIENLRECQRQLDMDGCEVGVSRQAVDEALEIIADLVRTLKEVRDGHGCQPGYIRTDTLQRVASVIDKAEGRS